MSVPTETPVARRTRRALLAGALGGLGALVAAAAAKLSPTHAAAGSPLIVGSQTNNSGTSDTQLIANSSVVTFKLLQNGPGTGLMGYATPTSGGTRGVYGRVDSPNGDGVQARNAGAAGSGAAVRAFGGNNVGVVAETSNGSAFAVHATNSGASGTALRGEATATSGTTIGVRGEITGHGYGVYGHAGAASGVSYGVYGRIDSTAGLGVVGVASAVTGSTYGVYGQVSSSTGYGVYGEAISATGYGVYSLGKAHVAGALNVTGAITGATKDFKIDHPLDPAQKFLSHSCVESDDRRTVYDGEVTLDARGEATVVLPAWFGALNGQTRIQLTPIGAGAADLHVKTKVANNRFVVAGGASGQEVYWHLSAIRQDAYAKAHPLAVEGAKAGAERGRYLHPEVYGKPASKGIDALQARPAAA